MGKKRKKELGKMTNSKARSYFFHLKGKKIKHLSISDAKNTITMTGSTICCSTKAKTASILAVFSCRAKSFLVWFYACFLGLLFFWCDADHTPF